MSKYTDEVKKAAEGLEKAEQHLSQARIRLATVRRHNGQSGYSVVVNGITVAVSQMDSRSYQGTLIRGREMIHLGALKALGAEVQAVEETVKKWADHLKAVTIGGPAE